MSKVIVLDHPLIQHKLAILRNQRTSVKEFRELVSEIAGLMCYEATRDLPTREVEVQTPVAMAKCRMIFWKIPCSWKRCRRTQPNPNPFPLQNYSKWLRFYKPR